MHEFWAEVLDMEALKLAISGTINRAAEPE
jgi:hypothetical protein